jgi:outer membrane receptor protein involved in Fe transport
MKRLKKTLFVTAPRPTRLAALIAGSCFAAMATLPSHAQDAAKKDDAAAAGATDVLNLNKIVVTGSSGGVSKMRSSVSVTDVEQQQVADFSPRSEAEVLHLIPGIRADSSAGPGGNSNISVRGLPIATGGSKYVQMQEDGLPVVEFGDMNFGNNDYWIRYDTNVDRIQTIRGGSASTFASHAPGAIINFISKTGEEEGGSVGVSRGLGYDETRVDAEYGGKISPTLRFHVGGFFRDGEGPRSISSGNAEQGYQIKANLTKTFNGDKGYFRASLKILSDHAPTYTSYPAAVSISGKTVGGFSSIPGFDALKDSQYSVFNTSMATVGPYGTGTGGSNLTNGITVETKAVGLEFHNQLENGFTVDDKFRYASSSSKFQTQFWGLDTLASSLSSKGAASAWYANGPKAGQQVTQSNLSSGFISNSAAINQQSPDMGNYANDLSLNRKLKFSDASSLDAKLGYYRSNQKVVQNWAISPLSMEVGKDGALIDYKDAAGAALTTMGLSGYNNNWGDCCARHVDASFTTDAPYLALNFASGPVDLDASLRHDSFKAQGYANKGVLLANGLDVNGDGKITGAEKNVMTVDVANPQPVNYTIGYTSYSLGANYQINKDLSGFARVSEGGRAVADRFLLSGNFDSAGKLLPGADKAAVAKVKQQEAGLKYRGRADWGSFGVFGTIYHTSVNEFNYDQTLIPKGLNPISQDGYKSDGFELESVFKFGNFGLNANAVYTNAQITVSSGGNVGKVPHGTSKFTYVLSPRYDLGFGSVGAAVVGKSALWADDGNNVQVEGHYQVNAFVNVDIAKDTTLSLNVNNLLNKLAPASGVDQGSIASIQALGAAVGKAGVVSMGPEAGRTVSLSLRYSF